jgi:translation initiation factor IF-2
VKLPQAPDRYERNDQDQLRNALEIELMRLQFHREPRRVLHLANVSTSSTSEVSLTSVVIVGGTLRLNAEQLHIRVAGYANGTTCRLKMKFGATLIADSIIPDGAPFEHDVTLVRTGDTTQTTIATYLEHGRTTEKVERVGPTEALGNDVLLDFRGLVATGTLILDAVSVQYLTTTTWG